MRILKASPLVSCALVGGLIHLAACSPPAPPPPVDSPRRIVTLAPNLTEIVFALGAGDRLVGRTSACNWPVEALAVPVVGGFGRPSLERLLQVKPDVVLDVDLEDEQMGAAMARGGLRRERIRCRSLGDIAPAIRQVGEVLGERAAAEELAGRIEKQLANRRSRVHGKSGPRVYLEIWPDPPMTAGSGAFVSEMLEGAGGVNIGGGSPREYYTLSAEMVLMKDPEVILALYPAEAESVQARLKTRPGWSQISAIRSGRVISGLNLDVILRPGPRVIEGLDLLEAVLNGAPPPRPRDSSPLRESR
jgi:iron complex transport system substrate-binding protein